MMRKTAQRDDVRDLILDAVEILLSRYGYKKMTMEDVALQVGIGKGTIYLHFPSKEELTLSHVDRIVQRLVQRLASIAQSSESAEVRIKKMLIERVLYRFDSVLQYSQNLDDLLSSLRAGLLIRRKMHFAQELEVFSRVLNEGRKKGLFQFRNGVDFAEVLLLTTNSLLPYSLTPRELGRRSELKEKVSRIADLLLHGLRRKVK